MINIRQKGFDAERDIALQMNAVILTVYAELGLPAPAKPIVQRNQLQSAVGGCDLTGTFGLAIEVKRQEALSINTWWAQCVKSAVDRNEAPVLLFRQSKQKWRCIMFVEVPLPSATRAFIKLRAEISFDDYLAYFKHLVMRSMQENPIIETIPHPTLFP